MEKTNLGISVGLLGAAIYFTGVLGGYVIQIILVGYVLIAEKNVWLRKTSVKAVALMISFLILSTCIGSIPNAFEFFNKILEILPITLLYATVSAIVAAIVIAISIIKMILFILLGVKALNQETIAIPFIDRLVDKYM